jgi:transposase InsO family protein
MRQLGIKGTHRRRYRKTTERDASLAVAPDLMNRNFTATKPDEKYVGDITYIRTWGAGSTWPSSSTSSRVE